MSDIEVAHFSLDEQEADRARTPAYARFSNPAILDSMAKATMEHVVTGFNSGAYFTPLVSYGIDFTVRALSLPTVRERLPREVTERSAAAEDIAFFAAQDGIRQNLFFPVYSKNRYLKVHMKNYEDRFVDFEYLAVFFSSPFYETSQVAGGAFAALGNRGVTENRADIVANSRGLLMRAKVSGEDRTKVDTFLGEPYARSDRYIVREFPRGTRVIFNRRTREVLAKYMGARRGCPAVSIRPQDNIPGSLVQRAYPRMVMALLYGDAVVTEKRKADKA